MSEPAPLTFRELRPADAEPLCRLLANAFESEYAAQGIDVLAMRWQFQLIGWINRLLSPLKLEFFKVTVALEGDRLLAAMTSFRAGRGAWYQGFGVVAPETRGRGLYRQVIRRSLIEVAARGGKVTGGEIRVDNTPALRAYRDNVGARLMPVQEVFLAPVAAIPPPARPVALARVRQAELAHLAPPEVLRARSEGGFLLEGEAERSLLAACFAYQLPPLTARSWAVRDGQRLRAFFRVRTHWPARLQAVDIAWVDPRESASEAREMLLSLLARVKPTTRAPIRIYVDSAETALAAVCRELGFSLLAALCPIRVDSVEQALARMSEEGRVRPEILAAEGQP